MLHNDAPMKGMPHESKIDASVMVATQANQELHLLPMPTSTPKSPFSQVPTLLPTPSMICAGNIGKGLNSRTLIHFVKTLFLTKITRRITKTSNNANLVWTTKLLLPPVHVHLHIKTQLSQSLTLLRAKQHQKRCSISTVCLVVLKHLFQFLSRCHSIWLFPGEFANGLHLLGQGSFHLLGQGICNMPLCVIEKHVISRILPSWTEIGMCLLCCHCRWS